MKSQITSRGYTLTPMGEGRWAVSNEVGFLTAPNLFGALVLCTKLYVGARGQRLVKARKQFPRKAVQ